MIEMGNFIKGSWEQSQNKFNVISPLDNSIIGEVSIAGKEEINLAVKAAVDAQKDWSVQTDKARAQVLFKLREILLRDIDKISEIVSKENGKIHAESKAGILKGIEVLEFALSLQNLDIGGKMEVSSNVYCEYRRRPLGVVASITPFNFPAMVPMWTIPIAIGLGNAYIWKPSEKTPLTAKFIADAFKEAGLPDGILSVVNGDADCVNSLIDHPDVKAISFVGSTKIAKLVYERTTGHGKRCLALGGAKNHIILMPDADLELTGMGISDSFTGCAGQRCMAASVLLAVGNVDKHIEKIIQRASSQTLGDSMGAIITPEQVSFLNKAVEKAVSEGAKIIYDGRDKKPPKNLEKGNWFGPVILDNVKAGSTAACDELFGPILSIIRCESLDDAIEVQNSSPYGNAASIFTSSGPMSLYAAERCEAGMFGINIGVPVPREPFSFGGIKASKFGHGDITGEHSLDFWSDVKKITTKWNLQKDHNWMS